jgi:hypothetical protein
MAKPMFSRRHYEAIADAIYNEIMAAVTATTHSTPASAYKEYASFAALFIDKMSTTFKRDNPSFDRTKFEYRCFNGKDKE